MRYMPSSAFCNWETAEALLKIPFFCCCCATSIIHFTWFHKSFKQSSERKIHVVQHVTRAANVRKSIHPPTMLFVDSGRDVANILLTEG